MHYAGCILGTDERASSSGHELHLRIDLDQAFDI